MVQPLTSICKAQILIDPTPSPPPLHCRGEDRTLCFTLVAGQPLVGGRQVGLTHLLGGLVPIVLLPPELRFHLELHILKVHTPVHWLDVAFCHVVGSPLPLLGMQEVGEFLPGEKDKGEPV